MGSPPYAFLFGQAADEVIVRLAVLGAIFPLGVLVPKLEDVGFLREAVLVQYLLDDVGDGHVLVDAVILRFLEEIQARRHFQQIVGDGVGGVHLLHLPDQTVQMACAAAFVGDVQMAGTAEQARDIDIGPARDGLDVEDVAVADLFPAVKGVDVEVFRLSSAGVYPAGEPVAVGVHAVESHTVSPLRRAG
nr:hypothetical protein [uncultured Desulfovibrio sp.]